MRLKVRRLPDVELLVDALSRLPAPLPELPFRRIGYVRAVGPASLKARLPGATPGEMCRIGSAALSGEVLAVEGDEAVLAVYGDTAGVHVGDTIERSGSAFELGVGHGMIGRVLDAQGNAVDGGDPVPVEARRPLLADPPGALQRDMVDTVLALGIRAIDGLLTCGRGQRVGIFAAAGVGKSTLLGMCMDQACADVIVLALVGERGREVREFLESTLTPAARARAVIVVSTSDRPAAERARCACAATTIAEYFRDQGMHVLLMVDSLTRYARATRELALAAGEPPVARGYPPSVFARLPALLERAGNGECGSITALYTVLVEGDDMNEPVADEVRSILDGHIVLSRRLAERGHFPSIDIGASVSRVMPRIVDARHRRIASIMRGLMTTYDDVEFLVRVGEFKRGEDKQADAAVDAHPAILRFLRQDIDERVSLDRTLDMMQEIAGEHAC
jgi:type III secretion protein N (ATPase)